MNFDIVVFVDLNLIHQCRDDQVLGLIGCFVVALGPGQQLINLGFGTSGFPVHHVIGKLEDVTQQLQ